MLINVLGPSTVQMKTRLSDILHGNHFPNSKTEGGRSVQKHERQEKLPVKTVMQNSNIMYSNKNHFKLQGA